MQEASDAELFSGFDCFYFLLYMVERFVHYICEVLATERHLTSTIRNKLLIYGGSFKQTVCDVAGRLVKASYITRCFSLFRNDYQTRSTQV